MWRRRAGVVGRDAHQPVHAGLGLQPAVGVGALDLQGRRLDPGLLAGGLLERGRRSCRGRWPSAVYMRCSITAQSLDSVPPAPELISTIGVVAVGLARRAGPPARRGPARSLRRFSCGARLLQRGLVALHRRPSRRTRAASASVALQRLRTASTWAASRVRSRIRAWASSGLSQRVGSSTRAFSSSSLRRAGSQSKTPPEQSDRLLDVGLGGLDIRSHGNLLCCAGAAR